MRLRPAREILRERPVGRWIRPTLQTGRRRKPHQREEPGVHYTSSNPDFAVAAAQAEVQMDLLLSTNAHMRNGSTHTYTAFAYSRVITIPTAILRLLDFTHYTYLEPGFIRLWSCIAQRVINF